MPTPSEKKALAFIATVILLGGAVRVVRAGGLAPADPTPTEQQALARQGWAADSASAMRKAAKAAKGTKAPKIRKIRVARMKTEDGVKVAGVPIDLDVASQAEIETLPRIGPALARRIVDSRTAEGPFRSLEGLKRVKGVGPAIISLLGPLVTFSGQTRP